MVPTDRRRRRSYRRHRRQAHFHDGKVIGPEELWSIFNHFAELGPDIQVTEFEFRSGIIDRCAAGPDELREAVGGMSREQFDARRAA